MAIPSANGDALPAAPCGDGCPGVLAVYHGLLAAHEQAAADGGPLFTDAGVSFVRRLVAAAQTRLAGPALPAPTSILLPAWDGLRYQLWLGGDLLKEFRQPAPNQVAVLAALQARGWVGGHVQDPLPRDAADSEVEARQRLHETLKNLNRGLPAGTIHFRSNGGGTGVWWEYAKVGGQRSGR